MKKKTSYTLYEDLLLVYEYVMDDPNIPTKVIFCYLYPIISFKN
jgi:hypothetical protein